MENSISIPSSHLKYLIPGYKLRLDEIEVLINDLEQERKEINNIVSNVGDNELELPNLSNINSNTVNDEYDTGVSWFSKAKFILEKEKKPLTTAQIVDRIISYEPGLNRVLVVKNISSILGTKSKEGKQIERFTTQGKDQRFGLK